MADGEVKGKISFEYDNSGAQAAKKDIADLAAQAGTLGEAGGQAGEGLQAIEESAGKLSPALTDVNDGMNEVLKTLPQINRQVVTQAQVFDDAADSTSNYSAAHEEAAQTVRESLPQIVSQTQAIQEQAKVQQVATQQVVASNEAMDRQAPMMQAFATSTKEANVQLGSFAATQQNVMKGLNANGGVGSAAYGPSLEGASLSTLISSGKPQEAIGNMVGGLMSGLNDLAMPLMAVQMLGMAVSYVGQGIYNAAAFAEGTGAHSFGTFTGTVDALGKTMQQAGGAFSEAFGQEIMPNLNAINTIVGGNMDLASQAGAFVGDFLSSASILGAGVLGGVVTIASGGFASNNPLTQYADQSVANLFQYPINPGGQAAARQNTNQMVTSPGQVFQGIQSNQTDYATLLGEAGDPDWLASQSAVNQAAAFNASKLASYTASHHIPNNQLVADSQLFGYNDQLYEDQQNGPSIGDILGNDWRSGDMGGFFGDLGAGWQGNRINDRSYNNTLNDTGNNSSNASGYGDFLGIDWGKVGQGFNDFFGIGNAQAASGLNYQGGNGGTPIAGGNAQVGYATGMGFAGNGGGSGSQDIVTDISHTFTATVNWDTVGELAHAFVGSPAWNVLGDLAHSFMGSPAWGTIGELAHSFMGSPAWGTLGELAHEFMGSPAWGTLGELAHEFMGSPEWGTLGDLAHAFMGMPEWNTLGDLAHQFLGTPTWNTMGDLMHQFTGEAEWAGKGLENLFTGKASWEGKDLEHEFVAQANWVANNLNPVFNVSAMFTGLPMFAGGVQNFGGGVAIVGENGPEVVTLPAGSSVYNSDQMPMVGSGAGTSIASLMPGGNGSGGTGGAMYLNLYMDSMMVASTIIPKIGPVMYAQLGVR